MNRFKVGDRWIGDGEPSYFVADIAANHDGDLDRAKLLIRLAKEAGADAAKFQNFQAAKIVSDFGFKALGGQVSHQAKWERTVFEVYEDASIPFDWTPILRQECDRVEIEYLSSPYDAEAIDMLEPHVRAYKIGSGDIDWLEALQRVAEKGKPVFLATGSATIADVQQAVDTILPINRDLALMQCNTNYTASLENLEHVHLNVLKTYATMFPEVVLGLSDHTPGHATVLGAIALGARVIEKHFTDDISRDGPDHKFSMTPDTWADMIERSRELEAALGSPSKRVADNEAETVLIQRRCLRAARDLAAGEMLQRADIDVLRPATEDGIAPSRINDVIGMRVRADLQAGASLSWTALKDAE